MGDLTGSRRCQGARVTPQGVGPHQIGRIHCVQRSVSHTVLSLFLLQRADIAFSLETPEMSVDRIERAVPNMCLASSSEVILTTR